jgi:hypothetical protein
VLDTVSDLGGKVKRRARKPWITQEMISKMEEQQKLKNVTYEKRKNYRRLQNEEKRVKEKAKKEYVDSICDKIMEFQRKGYYDLRRKSVDSNIGIKHSQGNTIVNQRQVLKILEDSVTELYDSAN